MASVQVDNAPGDTEGLSLAERRTRRQNRQPPLRYRDVPPETLPPLPPLLPLGYFPPQPNHAFY
jgi:hypothetical protein